MIKFKNMRHRVEFAYDSLNTDIYYEGNYLYTVEDHNTDEVFEMLEEKQVDYVLNLIWQHSGVEE